VESTSSLVATAFRRRDFGEKLYVSVSNKFIPNGMNVRDKNLSVIRARFLAPPRFSARELKSRRHRGLGDGGAGQEIPRD
jgi:hypothetical protein